MPEIKVVQRIRKKIYIKKKYCKQYKFMARSNRKIHAIIILYLNIINFFHFFFSSIWFRKIKVVKKKTGSSVKLHIQKVKCGISVLATGWAKKKFAFFKTDLKPKNNFLYNFMWKKNKKA